MTHNNDLTRSVIPTGMDRVPVIQINAVAI